MYVRSAPYYDKIYSFKDYAAEAEALRTAIERHRPEARRLLDVACGTGEHLRHLRGRFEAVGMDAAPEMLEVARAKLPDVRFYSGDMRSFDLGETFDAVLCMFGATGHLADEAELGLAIGRMAAHLAPGGVLLIEPWLAPEAVKPGHVTGLFVDEPQFKLARMSVSVPNGDRLILEMHHMVATPDGVEHFVERLDMALFPHDAYRSAFAAAGLTAEFDPQGPMGRGLFTAVKPAAS
jgi:SAM-dependent methyltransferase